MGVLWLSTVVEVRGSELSDGVDDVQYVAVLEDVLPRVQRVAPSTTVAATSSTTDAPTSSSPPDPESSAAENIIGREFNARAADANDMTEIPRELGLDGNFSEYASLTLWPDAGGPAIGSAMAISPLEPGDLEPRTDIIAIVEFLSDDGAAILQSRVVDAIEVQLDAGEQLSMVHYGCRDEADPTAVVIGAVQVEADAPRTQQPTTAWQVEPTAISERHVDGVLCDIVTDAGPPAARHDAAIARETMQCSTWPQCGAFSRA